MTTSSGGYLLDSHALLWWWFDPDRLSRAVYSLLLDPTREVWVSAASLWELSLKHHQGKLPELIFLSKSPLPGKETVLQETRYGSDFNLEQLRNFVQSKTGVWIVLAGCLSEFDELAQLFVRNSRSGKDRHKIIEETIKLIDLCEDEGRVQIGKMYLRIMKIMHEKEDKDFVQSEKTRIEKLLEQSISALKKEELQRKLNILKSFLHSSPPFFNTFLGYEKK